MYFRQLRLPDMGCASYIIGGEGACVVVDPRWDAVSQYIGLARRQGLQITHIVETHTHADHVSGATRLAARTGATILMHHNAAVTYPHQDVADGDDYAVGPARIRILHTPGHSADSISLLVRDAAGGEPPRLLSGDTLFVGDVGRPDLHGSGAAALADQLYTSLHERVLALADDVDVYPGHLAGSLCGRRMAPEPSTTIGRERRTNPALAIDDRDTFVRRLVADLPPRPPNVERIVALNRSGAPERRPEVRHLTPPEAVATMDGLVVIDGRDPAAFAQGHPAGAINVPVGYGQFGVMVAWLLSPDTSLLLITVDEEDLAEAVDALMAVGMTNPLSALAGDVADWKAAGLTVAQMPTITVDELAERRRRGEIRSIVDVREPSEVAQGTIEGAITLPYRLLRERGGLPALQEPVAVVCNSGNRSMLGASLFARLGIAAVNVEGGTSAWEAAGFPLVQPAATAA